MKINFQATYRELSSIIKAPLRADESTTPAKVFTKLLSSISPDKSQPNGIVHENIKVVPTSVGIKSAEAEAMASFSFSPPSLKFEDISRLAPSQIPESLVKEDPTSVKTPAILNVRRLNGDEEATTSEVIEESPRASLNPSSSSTAAVSRQDTMSKVADLVLEAGKKHGIDPSLSMAVVSAESSFNSRAVSSDGHASKGLFQLLDSTGKDLLKRTGETAPYEPFDPDLNANLGVGYLRYLHDLFSKDSNLPNDLRTIAAANSSSLEKLAVAAFNAGEGRVASAQSRAQKTGLNPAIYENVEAYLPENTQEYVRKVISAKRDFEARFIG